MTKAGEGVCCEVTGEVPVEERERRLSEARGTFLKQGEDPLNEKCTETVTSLPTLNIDPEY